MSESGLETWLDRRLDTGLQCTLGLLALGVVAGFYSVWRLLVRRPR